MPKGSEGLVLILPNWDRLPAFEGGSGEPAESTSNRLAIRTNLLVELALFTTSL